MAERLSGKLALPFGLAATGILATYIASFSNLAVSFGTYFGLTYAQNMNYVPEKALGLDVEYSLLSNSCKTVYNGQTVENFSMQDLSNIETAASNLNVGGVLNVLKEILVPAQTWLIGGQPSPETLALCKPFIMKDYTWMEETQIDGIAN